MKKLILHPTILALALAATVWGGTLAQPCQGEDFHNCTWYAATQGNGKGISFTDYGTGYVVWPQFKENR
jgi:hypothetical protein